MEESQRKLNDAISTMSATLHRNYLRRIYVCFLRTRARDLRVGIYKVVPAGSGSGPGPKRNFDWDRDQKEILTGAGTKKKF
jgi:hypothetical protein